MTNNPNQPAAKPTALSGVFYDGSSSAGTPCELIVQPSGKIEIEHPAFDASQNRMFQDIDVPSRMGNTARMLPLNASQWFETSDNDTLDQLEKRFHKTSWYFNPYHWETKARYWLFSVVLILVMFFGGLFYGLPWISDIIAKQLSPSASEAMAGDVLVQLDRFLFANSTLDADRQAKMQQLFDDLLEKNGVATTDFSYTLHIRGGKKTVGANAFALPNGDIIFTDELIRLSDDDCEIQSIMLHEIGHVEHRHALRQTIQTAGAGLLMTWLFGDIEAASELLLALPAVLLNANYSRDFENEADDYALEKMLQHRIDPICFVTIMEKLVHSVRTVRREEPLAEDQEDTADEAPMDFFSSHPATPTRNQKFRRASATFQQHKSNP